MPSLNHDEPIDSVEHAAEHALKMGWLEKEAEESILGGWSRRFVVLTGWDGQEAHLFYYRSETDKEASGILFVSEMDIERSDDPRVFTLQVALPVGCCVCNLSEADSTDLPQGSQRRFRFRSDSAEMARQWLTAIEEVKGNGPHQCRTGEACLAWRKDKHAKTCQHCKRIFNQTRDEEVHPVQADLKGQLIGVQQRDDGERFRPIIGNFHSSSVSEELADNTAIF